MTVRYELSRMPDKNGFCKIRIRFTDKGRSSYQSTPLKVKPEYWDQAGQRVLPKVPNASHINEQLRLKMAELTLQAFKQPQEMMPMEQVPLFVEYAIECLSRWEKTKSPATIKAYNSMLTKVKEYDSQVLLSGITADWLLRYEAWSRNDGCQDSGALKRVAFVSIIINEALRYGKLQHNPFMVYRKPAKHHPAKVWLTIEELKSIEAMETNSIVLQHVATWFLLACYTGLRYSDIEKFDPAKHIQEGRIILYTTKSGEVVSLKINAGIKRMLHRWQQHGNVRVYSNQKCNQYLKAIAVKCGIDKLLTFHTARHTFAVQCANKGISQEVTSKLLGHSDLRTTATYYKIVNERIDAEMMKWDA